MIREMIVHLLFVMLAQLVCKQGLDDNAFFLAENARIFMVDNAVTNSYFGGKNYEMRGGVVTLFDRDIVTAPSVSEDYNERNHILIV